MVFKIGFILSTGTLRVTHFAKSHWIFAATSFSHPFYLVIKENPKKVEKSCHLGVSIHPPWFCTRVTTEMGLLEKNLYFEAFLVLPEGQMTSQTIRHQKLHGKRYQECPNRTILRDFRLFEVQINY